MKHYVKQRGTKKCATKITRSQKMRVSSLEVVALYKYTCLPKFKPPKLDSSRPWDVSRRIKRNRVKAMLELSPALIAAGFVPLD